MIGYQQGSTDAFRTGSQTLEGPYVDGVSLTHGSPGARQHAAETHETTSSFFCPCAGGAVPPSFVGNEYFCENGHPGTTNIILYASDPLWDGQGGESTPCCKLNSPPGVTAPWFCKQLPQATNDDLEVRICGNEATANDDTPVELIELYIR